MSQNSFYGHTHENRPNDRPEQMPGTCKCLIIQADQMKENRPQRPLETVQRIEPARLENPPEAVADLVAELSAL
jgi:hypothetical protein